MARVEIYTRDFCSYSTRAVALLARKGANFSELRAGDDPELRREMIQRANGGATYPQIFINGRHVGGCDELHDLEQAGRLDAMLAEPATSPAPSSHAPIEGRQV